MVQVSGGLIQTRLLNMFHLPSVVSSIMAYRLHLSPPRSALSFQVLWGGVCTDRIRVERQVI